MTAPPLCPTTIRLLAGREPRLVAVADTHSQPHPRALERIRALAPAAILHGGDIGSLDVVDALSEIAPTFAVRGNIDERLTETPDELLLELVGDDDEAALRLYLTHIAVRGPRLRREVRERARALGAALVVCGHSHVPLIAEDTGIAVFNPGSIGPRRFSLPITFGVMELGERGWQLRHVDVETGRPWSPGQQTGHQL